VRRGENRVTDVPGLRGGTRVIYLGGLGRSGSTLLERLLGELPGVSACGEVVHMWQRGIALDERCGCGEQFGACDFWSQVGTVAFGGWHKVSVEGFTRLRQAVDRTRFIPLLASSALPARMRRDLDEYTSYYARVYQAIAQVSGCATLVDSSKHASLAFCLSRCAEIDLRVVHLVRDSRAVAYSWTTRVERPEASAGSYMTTYPPMSALHLLARRGVPVLRVRYEDLVRSPEPTVADLARFAGLPPGDLGPALAGMRADSGSVVLSQGHLVCGNPMRFATGTTMIRGDDRWRTAMPSSQRRAVTAITLPLLARYGYRWRAA
jgi:hypothetical protein